MVTGVDVVFGLKMFVSSPNSRSCRQYHIILPSGAFADDNSPPDAPKPGCYLGKRIGQSSKLAFGLLS